MQHAMSLHFVKQARRPAEKSNKKVCQQTHHAMPSVHPFSAKKCHISTKQHEGVKELTNSCSELAWTTRLNFGGDFCEVQFLTFTDWYRWRDDKPLSLWELQIFNIGFKQKMTHDMLIFLKSELFECWMLIPITKNAGLIYVCVCVWNIGVCIYIYIICSLNSMRWCTVYVCSFLTHAKVHLESKRQICYTDLENDHQKRYQNE